MNRIKYFEVFDYLIKIRINQLHLTLLMATILLAWAWAVMDSNPNHWLIFLSRSGALLVLLGAVHLRLWMVVGTLALSNVVLFASISF